MRHAIQEAAREDTRGNNTPHKFEVGHKVSVQHPKTKVSDITGEILSAQDGNIKFKILMNDIGKVSLFLCHHIKKDMATLADSLESCMNMYQAQ